MLVDGKFRYIYLYHGLKRQKGQDYVPTKSYPNLYRPTDRDRDEQNSVSTICNQQRSIMSSTKHGSGSGGGNDPFKNNTTGSMSRKLKDPKKKRGASQKEEEHTSVSMPCGSSAADDSHFAMDIYQLTNAPQKKKEPP